MKPFTTAADKLRKVARYLDSPDLIPFRRQGGQLDLLYQFRQAWLQDMDFATILDIGANVGSFSFTLRKAYPAAQIYGFEPIPECYEALSQRMAFDTKFTAFNIALGEQNGTMNFNRNSYAAASSVLPITVAHERAFPGTSSIQPTQVRTARLDDLAEQLHWSDPILVKLDVQG